MRGAMSAEPRQPGPPDVGTPASTIPMGLRILAMVLRALFIGALVAVTARISSPQSESILTVYETPGDLIRLALGIAGCLWMVIQLFMLPEDEEGYRILALPRPCRRPARIGGRHRHLVRCAAPSDPPRHRRMPGGHSAGIGSFRMAPATELTAAMNHVSYPCERNSNPPAFARFRQVACMPENRRRFFLDQALSSFGGAPRFLCHQFS